MSETGTRPHRPRFLHSLSFKLLLLTVFFVMLAEFLIWTPSVARYRKVYLEENIARAHLSMLAIENMPEQEVRLNAVQLRRRQPEFIAHVMSSLNRRIIIGENAEQKINGS